MINPQLFQHCWLIQHRTQLLGNHLQSRLQRSSEGRDHRQLNGMEHASLTVQLPRRQRVVSCHDQVMVGGWIHHAKPRVGNKHHPREIQNTAPSFEETATSICALAEMVAARRATEPVITPHRCFTWPTKTKEAKRVSSQPRNGGEIDLGIGLVVKIARFPWCSHSPAIINAIMNQYEQLITNTKVTID